MASYDLKSLCAYLSHHLPAGCAPSYATLRRHASAGQFDGCISATAPGKRALYNAEAVLSFYQDRLRPTSAKQDKRVLGQSAGLTQPLVEQLLWGLNSFDKRLTAMETRLASLASAIESSASPPGTATGGVDPELLSKVMLAIERADSIKVAMMLKYDAENAALSRDRDEARKQIQLQNEVASLSREVSRIAIMLTAMKEKLQV